MCESHELEEEIICGGMPCRCHCYRIIYRKKMIYTICSISGVCKKSWVTWYPVQLKRCTRRKAAIGNNIHTNIVQNVIPNDFTRQTRDGAHTAVLFHWRMCALKTELNCWIFLKTQIGNYIFDDDGWGGRGENYRKYPTHTTAIWPGKVTQ